MKLLFGFAVILALTGGRAFAQGAQGVLVKNKAKAVAAGNNAPAGTAPGVAAPAPRAGIDPVQQQNIDKLAENLRNIRSGVAVTAEQKQMLETNFTTLTKTAIKPSPASLTKLANDLAAGLSDKSVTVKDQAQVAKDINIVLNSVNLSVAQVQGFINVAQNVLKDGGVTPPQAQTVADDLKAIVTELQASKAKP